MKTVVIMEPVSSGWKLIPKAKQFGHRVVVFTANTGERIVPEEFLSHADHVVIVDTNDDEATLQAARQLHKESPIDAVIPGFEYYVPLANIVNSALGLRSLNPERVYDLRYKHQMRAALERHQVRIPRYRVITEQEQIDHAIQHVGFPSVIKPVDCSGSSNVRKVANGEELLAGFAAIHATEFTDLERLASREVLIEEYVSGPEYSVEGYIEEGKATFLSITEKLLGPEPYFVEAGHVVSAELSADQEEEIYTYVNDVLTALAVTMGPFHAEIRLSIDGPVLMEVGARLAGDHICDLIHYARGIDLYEVIINSYLGLPLPPKVQEQAAGQTYAGIKFFMRPELMTYSELHGEQQVRAEGGFLELSITHPANTEIPEATSFMGRLGYAIFVKDNYQELKETLERVDDMLTFVGDANWR